MRSHVAMRLIPLLIVSLTVACSSLSTARHQYLMRGQVLEVQRDEVVICVGTKDGAEVGQELTAYEFTLSTPVGRAIRPPYQRVQTGTVRISEVIDEHFAKARITSGSPDVHDLVELNR